MRSDLISLLLADHKTVEGLLGEIDESSGDMGGLFTRIKATLETHETAEEEVLYPAVRRYVDNGDELADARIAEQDEAAELLGHMADLAPDGAQMRAAFSTLKATATAHAKAEESDVFPRLQAAVGGEVLDQLGREFAKSKAEAGSSANGRSGLDQQQDPRGDLLKARPGGDTAPGGWVPPYEGRSTGLHDQSDSARSADTGGLGQAAASDGEDFDDLDFAHHKGSPEDAEPDLVPSEGQAKYS